jgi:hypothetical protein
MLFDLDNEQFLVTFYAELFCTRWDTIRYFQQDVLAPRGFAFAFGLFALVVSFEVLVLVDGSLVSGSLFTDDFETLNRPLHGIDSFAKHLGKLNLF